VTLVSTICTKLALAADRCDPFDARSITDLPQILDVRPHRNDNASAFMTSYTTCAFGHLEGPFIME
jgi:hypothetical protein